MFVILQEKLLKSNLQTTSKTFITKKSFAKACERFFYGKDFAVKIFKAIKISNRFLR